MKNKKLLSVNNLCKIDVVTRSYPVNSPIFSCLIDKCTDYLQKQKLCLYIPFMVTLFIVTLSCKDINSQNIYSIPQRVLIEDTISAPEFIGGYKSFKAIMSNELNKIYSDQYDVRYSRIYFLFKINEEGIASDQKVITVTDNVKKKFNQINSSLLDKIKNWKPAFNKKGEYPVEYILRIEVESFDKKITLSLLNNDLRRLFEEDL